MESHIFVFLQKGLAKNNEEMKAKVILAMNTNSTASVEGIEIIRLIDFLIE